MGNISSEETGVITFGVVTFFPFSMTAARTESFVWRLLAGVVTVPWALATAVPAFVLASIASGSILWPRAIIRKKSSQDGSEVLIDQADLS